jgi:hypothetical protein
MKLFFFITALLGVILGLLAPASAALPVNAGLRQILVTYPSNTPDSVVDEAKAAIVKAVSTLK